MLAIPCRHIERDIARWRFLESYQVKRTSLNRKARSGKSRGREGILGILTYRIASVNSQSQSRLFTSRLVVIKKVFPYKQPLNAPLFLSITKIHTSTIPCTLRQYHNREFIPCLRSSIELLISSSPVSHFLAKSS